MSSSRNRNVRIPHLNELPPAFEWQIYVNHPQNKDLIGFSEHEATYHYTAFGRNEGRVSSQVDQRSAFLQLIPAEGLLLEIGPFCTPSFSPADRPVRFLDVFPTEELRDIVAELSWGKPDEVPAIDYVWDGEHYVDLIDERFDVVFSSHNIEHQPCLITHLQDVASVMRPGRRLFLVIPDRRFCFDYHLSDSTIADVLDAFLDKRKKHSVKSILEHQFLLTHNEAAAHWTGEHGPDTRFRLPDSGFLEELKTSIQNLADA